MANEQQNATGTWKASTKDVTLAVELNQNGSSITGKVTMSLLGHSGTFPVSGEASGLNVSFRGTSNIGGRGEFAFNGKYDPPPNALKDTTNPTITLRRG